MTSIRTRLNEAITRLESKKVAGARLDAELLMAHVLRRDRTWVLAHDDEKLSPAQITNFERLVDLRSDHVPLVHLTGTREFYGLSLQITPDVLTPRVETEQIVDWAIKHSPADARVIDIGTGSGAIAIALGVTRPDLHIAATEISADALKVAVANARKFNTDIEFVESDLWQDVAGLFDTIVTNLPYLRDDADLMPEVKREPAIALFGGADGLMVYRRFLEDVPSHLKVGGFLFTECDPWQHESLIAEAARYGLVPVEQGYFILGFKLQTK